MRRLRLIVICGVIAVLSMPVRAEDVSLEKAPELRGVLAEENGKRFGLFIPASGQTGWAMVGQTLGGWKLKEYRAADGVLVLAKGEREERLRLSESVVGTYRPGTPADVRALLDAMKFERRMRELDWTRNMPKQLLTNSGLPNPTSKQLAEFKEQIDRLFDVTKMQSLMAEALGGIYTQEELSAQAVFYGSEAGQAVLDQQAGGDEEPAALKEFYATQVGSGVKAKQSLAQAQMQKTVTPWLNETMEEIGKAAITYAKAQAAPVAGAKP